MNKNSDSNVARDDWNNSYYQNHNNHHHHYHQYDRKEVSKLLLQLRQVCRRPLYVNLDRHRVLRRMAPSISRHHDDRGAVGGKIGDEGALAMHRRRAGAGGAATTTDGGQGTGGNTNTSRQRSENALTGGGGAAGGDADTGSVASSTPRAASGKRTPVTDKTWEQVRYDGLSNPFSLRGRGSTLMFASIHG